MVKIGVRGGRRNEGGGDRVSRVKEERGRNKRRRGHLVEWSN